MFQNIPETTLRVRYRLSHFIFTATIRGRFHHPHFRVETLRLFKSSSWVTRWQKQGLNPGGGFAFCDLFSQACSMRWKQ